MPEHQTIEYKESWQDEFLSGFVDMQMLMAEHFMSVKTMKERLLDLAIKTERNCWNPFLIKLRIQWGL